MPVIPWEDMWPIFSQAAPAAFGASLVVMLLFRLLGGERLMPVAAALAIAAGVVAANHFHNAITWELHPTRSWSANDLLKVLGRALEEKPVPVDEDEADTPFPLPPASYWLPLLAGLAMLVEVLVGLPGVPAAVACIARTAVALLAARLLTPSHFRPDFDWRLTMPWLSWGIGLVITLEWSILAALSRQWKDGTIATALVFCLAAVSIVVEWETKTGSYAAIAVFFSTAMMAVAGISWFKGGDASPAFAAAAIVIPGLLNISYYGYAGQPPLPVSHFLLAGLAPLAFALMFLPFMMQLEGWKRWLPGIVLPLIPAGLAVHFALQTPVDAPYSADAATPPAAVE